MAVQDRYKHYLADQRRHFDELVTEDWHTYLTKNSVITWRFEVSMLFRWIRPASILDLGCGCGFHDAEMAKRPFVKRLDAIDYSPRSIDRARESFSNPKITYRAMDFSEIGDDPLYDLVVSFQVIEHLEDPMSFMRLCTRKCKPGGHVAVYTVDRMRPYNRVRMRYGKPAEMEDPMHKQEFSRQDLKDIGLECGLKVRRIFSYAVASPWKIVSLGLWAGYLLPSWGTRLGAIYAKP